MIGDIVTVKVDRPMGSYHPKHKDIYYPTNYGYIEGIIAPDGEEQDAYLLGLDEPVQEYTGIIIAIIHRYDDIEEKWVVAPKGMTFIKPVYPEYSSIKDKKYITWKTANEDISKQRKKGYKGKRFVICPKLVNKNQGKTKIVEKIWNKKFNQYVPKHWAKSADCEVHKKKIQVKPKWEYHIIAIKKL